MLMSRSIGLSLLVVVLLAPATLAVTVTTPETTAEVFSKGDLVDIVALLRLAGAEAEFSPAAGSFAASANGHQVQFTPGGSLAILDGRLTSLPGSVRQVEGKVVTPVAVAAALLAPLGWTLSGTPGGLSLSKATAMEHITVDAGHGEAGTTIVIRGTDQRPRVTVLPGKIALLFPRPVTLAAAISPGDVVLGGELVDTTLTLKVPATLDVGSSYPLEEPPRFVLRLVSAQPAVPVAGAPSGTVVVLDPGHGGDDEGARGPAGEVEKDIVLAVARATAARLQTAGITARLTRESDEKIALTDRTGLANRLHAVAFVSIHANASAAKGAKGAETYYMSADASDAGAAQAALRENAGAAAPDAVKLILWDLAYVANLNSSARLARGVQERLNTLQGIRARGVRQAPFVVLTGATMPATLVEVGFISNPGESTKLVARETQDQIATALAEAIVEFIRTPELTPTPAPAATP
jgi:N-acetylmuramoyl-L-alanine amidase